MTTTRERLQILSEEYEAGFQAVQARRQEWAATAKDVILPAMQEAIGAMKQVHSRWDLYALEFSRFTNSSVVQFSFSDIPTGIFIEDEKGWASGIQRGADLIFSQGQDGRVVTFANPFATDLPRAPKRAEQRYWIGCRFERPTEITREVVLDVIASFVEWAKDSNIFCRARNPAADSTEWREIREGLLEAPYKQEHAPIGFTTDPKHLEGSLSSVSDKEPSP
ncbi:MAG: hypothetical protein PHU25_19590 [Deltaproteobacteria bacterium]|nr:hypothetical protein [Deltaproteobacteria bacterium]